MIRVFQQYLPTAEAIFPPIIERFRFDYHYDSRHRSLAFNRFDWPEVVITLNRIYSSLFCVILLSLLEPRHRPTQILAPSLRLYLDAFAYLRHVSSSLTVITIEDSSKCWTLYEFFLYPPLMKWKNERFRYNSVKKKNFSVGGLSVAAMKFLH